MIRHVMNLESVNTYEGVFFLIFYKLGNGMDRKEGTEGEMEEWSRKGGKRLFLLSRFLGTHDIHGLILGRAITGIQSFFSK